MIFSTTATPMIHKSTSTVNPTKLTHLLKTLRLVVISYALECSSTSWNWMQIRQSVSGRQRGSDGQSLQHQIGQSRDPLLYQLMTHVTSVSFFYRNLDIKQSTYLTFAERVIFKWDSYRQYVVRYRRIFSRRCYTRSSRVDWTTVTPCLLDYLHATSHDYNLS